MHPWPSPRAGGCGSVRVRGRAGLRMGRMTTREWSHAPDAALPDHKKTHQGREGGVLPKPFWISEMSAPEWRCLYVLREGSSPHGGDGGTAAPGAQRLEPGPASGRTRFQGFIILVSGPK